MISLAQVVAAMAAGAMPPVTALLMIEMRGPRLSADGGGQEVEPPDPGRIVDDDELDWRIEAVAQLAAARFELLGRAADNGSPHVHAASDVAELHSRGHLTLIPTMRALRRPSSPQAGKKRSPGQTECMPRAMRSTSPVRRPSAPLPHE